jgi:hypothetical protein
MQIVGTQKYLTGEDDLMDKVKGSLSINSLIHDNVFNRCHTGLHISD